MRHPQFTRAPLALLAAQLCCQLAWAQTGSAETSAAAQADKAKAQATTAAAAKPAATLPTVVIRDKLPPQNTVIHQHTLDTEPPKNIRNLFDNVIGVDFSTTGAGQLGDIEIRGMGGMGDTMGTGSSRVGMEVDGMDVPQSFFFGHNVRNGRQYFDSADLKTVEVQKGPGSGGLAGNVKFRTKDPVDYLRPGQRIGGDVRAGYSGDTRDRSLGATVAGQMSETASASLSFTGRRFNELDNKGGLDVDGAKRTKPNPYDGESKSVNLKVVLQPARQHKFTVLAQHFDSSYDINLRSSLGLSSAYNTFVSTNRQDNTRNALSLVHEMEAKTPAFDHLRWQLSTQRTNSEGFNTTDRTTLRTGQRSIAHDDNYFKVTLHTLKADFDKTLGNAAQGGWQHDLRYGLRVQRGTLKQASLRYNATTSREHNFFPEDHQTITAAHLSDRIQFGASGISLTPSINATHISTKPKLPANVKPQPGTSTYSKTSLGGGLLLEWQPSDSQLLAASYTRSTRLPGYGETNAQSYGHWIGRPNPNLKPETGDALDLSWASASDLGQQKTTFFYNRYKNMIDVDYETDPAYALIYNEEGDFKLYGLEFEGRLNLAALGAPRGLSLDGGLIYTKGKSENRLAQARANPLNGKLTLRYTAPGDRWSLALRSTFSQGKSEKDLPPGGRTYRYWGTPGYAAFDLVGYFKPTPQLTLSGGIYNLADKKYVRWSRYRGASTIQDWTRYSEAGRHIGINLRYQF